MDLTEYEITLWDNNKLITFETLLYTADVRPLPIVVTVTPATALTGLRAPLLVHCLENMSKI